MKNCRHDHGHDHGKIDLATDIIGALILGLLIFGLSFHWLLLLTER